MNTSLPVIFLAFANEYHEGRYLNKLVEEHRQLSETLGPISSNESAEGGKRALCELVIRQNATIKDIFDVFQKYEGRISIFHYAGHADGYQLLLQGKDGEGKVAHGGGLVSLLSRKRNLKLVFLNGCATQKLAQDLTGRGVPTVIGTATSIPDGTALQISSRFYYGLARGLTLSGAWEEAKAEVMTGIDPKDTHRGFQLQKEDSGRFPWDVEFKDDASKEIFNNWNLPGAANQPLFGLPEPKKQKLPPSPFLFLKPYEADHAEIFFGRSYYIRDLYLKILEPNSPPIILLYGESGAGKSSLLDAGLQPRLAAAVDPETEKTLFDVRYHRRDQDLGLVGTLAEVLSYYDLTVEGPEMEGTQAEEDPNREKIRAIESIAREMEEEAANSFLNLIERYKAIRTYKSGTAYRQNLYRTGDLDAYAGAQLREAWLNIEKKTGRRLVIILDQVEELFTRPNSNMDKELEDLLQVLYEIFGTPAEKVEEEIRGKIILGYREEYNAKIEARVKDYGLSRSTVFLEQLNRKDILDIFQGLESGVVREHYNIALEDSLPDHVANQLLSGKETASPGQAPVAPVLQLLLTKLWNKAYRENNHQPAFTVDAYNEVQSQGKEMEEYYLSQMQKIESWKPEVVESGLALDILAYHISDLGTSRRCSIEDMRLRYRHLSGQYPEQPDIVDQLVNRLKSSEIFLLNDVGRGYTSLPHDTLAPIIMREYNRSDKLGQRSARILDTKRPDFIRALHTPEEKKVRLDDNDLEVVTGGIKGMRALEEEEKTLLQISMEEREKRLRLRRILLRGGIVAGLFILFLAAMAGMLSISVVEQLKSVAIDRALEESLKQQDNPGKENLAPELGQFAFLSQGKEKRLDVVKNYYELAGPYLFEATDAGEGAPGKPADHRPVFLSIRPGAKVSSLNYYPSLGPLVSLEDGTVKYWPGGLKENERTIDVRSFLDDWFAGDVDSTDYNKLNAGFSGDGKYIQVLFRYNLEPLYKMAGKLVPAPTLDISVRPLSDEYQDDYLWEEEYEEDDEAYAYEEEDYTEPESVGTTYIGYYDLFTGKFVDEYGLNYTLEEFWQRYGDQELFVNDRPFDTEALFSFQLMNEESQLFRGEEYEDLKQYGWNIYHSDVIDTIIQRKGAGAEIPLLATKNMIRGEYNSCLVWDPENLHPDPTSGFYYEETLDYLSALTRDSFLTMSPDGEMSIRNARGLVLRSLLEPGSDILDIGLSPDQQHFFAIVKDSVVIWKLDGSREKAYRHPNIRSYAFSVDGSRLVTLSSGEVWVWSASKNALRAYPKGETVNPIGFARFQEDNLHLIVGLDVPKGAAKSAKFPASLWKKNKQNKARIDYWNVETGRVEQSYEVSCERLVDASISLDGKFAVALEPGKASVIPRPKEKVRRWEYNTDGIEILRPKKGAEARETQRVFLSPNGKYIVRHTPKDNRTELFDRRGRSVNAFSFQRYTQGFNGQLFTPDDHYLLASKSDEVFYWHPEEDSIHWPPFYELSLQEKEAYNLTTFIDYIPGTKDNAKWWAIGILILSMIYALLYFSGAIIQFIHKKTYLELGLYGAGFALLTVSLVGIWIGGAEDAELKKVAFYGLIWATLGILALSIYRAGRERKFQTLATLGVVGLLLVIGSFQFFKLETKQHQAAYKVEKREYARSMRDVVESDYPYNTAYYDSLYQTIPGSSELPLASTGLTRNQLVKVAEVVYPASNLPRTREWPLLLGLLLLAVFIGLVGYPLYRAIGKYRKEKLRAFYSWLLLPLGFTLLGLWVVFAGLTGDDFGDNTVDLLNGVAGIFLLAIVVRKSWQYLKLRKFAAFAVFAVPTLFVASVLLLSTGALTPLPLAATFIYAREEYRRKSFGRSFLFFSGCMLLLAGVILYTGLSASFVLLIGTIALSPLLVWIYYSLRKQLKNLPERKAAGKWRALNWLVILGLWLLAWGLATYFSYQLDMANTDDYYYEDAYLYEEEELGPGEGMEEGDSLPVEETGQSDQEADPLEEAPEPETQADETAFTGTALNARQQFIVDLFDADESVRDEARKQLSSSIYASDLQLIPELLQYSQANPTLNEGLWNALYLLEKLTDEQLSNNFEAVSGFLDWMAQKGYGPSTMQRISNLQRRVGG